MRDSLRQWRRSVEARVQDGFERDAAPVGTGVHRRGGVGIRPVHPCSAELVVDCRSQLARADELHVDSTGGSGHRALDGGPPCAESHLLRSPEHRETCHGKGVQRRGLDAGCVFCAPFYSETPIVNAVPSRYACHERVLTSSHMLFGSAGLLAARILEN